MDNGLRPARRLAGRDMSEANEATFRGLVRHLQGSDRGATPRTIAAYHQGCASLEAYLLWSGAPSADLLDARRSDVLGWVGALREAGGWRMTADGTLARLGRPLAKDSIASYFSSARRLHSWAAAEGLTEASPFDGIRPPKPSDKPVAIASRELITAMIATCRPRGRKPGWMDLRDELVIRLMAETGGPRLHEVAQLPLEHLDMRRDLVTVHGKGGRVRRFPMSPRTATSAQRWLRARAALRHADLPYVVIGVKGQMHPDGVGDIIDRRSAMAGGHTSPHKIRHFAADAAKSDEMTDGDMMALFGWNSEKMLRRYGREREEQRAIEASRRHAIGNRL